MDLHTSGKPCIGSILLNFPQTTATLINRRRTGSQCSAFLLLHNSLHSTARSFGRYSLAALLHYAVLAYALQDLRATIPCDGHAPSGTVDTARHLEAYSETAKTILSSSPHFLQIFDFTHGVNTSSSPQRSNALVTRAYTPSAVSVVGRVRAKHA